MQSNHTSVRSRWGEKPYYSLDYYLKETFGQKVYKIALDAGMTCPNRDGTLDTRGCIFCSEGGSGDFATTNRSITAAIDEAICRLNGSTKETGQKYIAYFQSFSNTYAPIDILRPMYLEALAHPDIVGLSIATRPDCFSPEIFSLLDECRQIKPTWIELGLQTVHEHTARFIRRGYPLHVFEQTAHTLHTLNIPVIVHVILGLPGETEADILETIQYLNTQHIQGIKLQLLHVLKGTDLAVYLEEHPWHILTQEEYVDLVIRCIGNLSPEIVIHRLTGDGPKDLLIAPRWSCNKRAVLNHIAHSLKTEQVYQGKYYSKQKGNL